MAAVRAVTSAARASSGSQRRPEAALKHKYRQRPRRQHRQPDARQRRQQPQQAVFNQRDAQNLGPAGAQRAQQHALAHPLVAADDHRAAEH